MCVAPRRHWHDAHGTKRECAYGATTMAAKKCRKNHNRSSEKCEAHWISERFLVFVHFSPALFLLFLLNVFPSFRGPERKKKLCNFHPLQRRANEGSSTFSHVFLIFFVVFFGEISCSVLFRESGTKTLRSSTRTIMYDIPEKENNNNLLSRRRDCARKASLKNDKWIFRPTSVEFTHIYSFCSLSARVQWGKNSRNTGISSAAF